MSTRVFARSLSLVALLSFCGGALQAQGYETKFKAIGFKPGDVYHSDEGVSVSLNGGSLEVTIPLGPAIPGPIPIRPSAFLHQKYVQPVNPAWRFGIWREDNFPSAINQTEADLDRNWKRWGTPTMPSGGMHPGKLTFYTGGNGIHANNIHAPFLQVVSPFGKSVEVFEGQPGLYVYTAAETGEIRQLLANVAPEWAYTASWGTPATGAGALRTSTGSILVFGPYDHTITSKWDFYTNADGSTKNEFTTLPTEVLEVDGDLITLWRFSRNYYQPDYGGGITTWGGTVHIADIHWWQGSIYHPVWIRNRSGFKLNVQVFRDDPADHWNPELTENGLLTGFKIWAESSGQGFQVGPITEPLSGQPSTVTYTGMWNSQTTGFNLSGATTDVNVLYEGEQTNGWEVHGLYRKYYGLDTPSDELGFGGLQIVCGPITYDLEFNGPHKLLSKLTTSTGKTYDFTYAIKQGAGVNRPIDGQISGWDYTNTAPALEYWSVVTKMSITAGGETRDTTYQWAIPRPDMVVSDQYGNWTWSTRHQGVAQTLPDGQTILHVFAPAVDIPALGMIPAPTLEQWARTFLAQRQTPVARYYYAAGDTSWSSFVTDGVDPAGTTWYRRELLEGFDLRGWEGALTQILANTEPRPTRTIREERSGAVSGPVEVTEQDAWDPARNTYGTTRTYSLPAGTSTAGLFWAPGLFGGGSSYPTPSGVLAHTLSTTTFAAVESGLFARPYEQTTQILSAPSSGITGTASSLRNTFKPGALAHLLADVSQIATDGSGQRLTTAFGYGAWGGYQRMSDVSLSSPNLAGTAGYTYDYDGTGRWLTSIQPQGVPWHETEPTHDWAGRPLAQVDANGIQTTYDWDDLGRLKGIYPPSPELPTTLTYDADFLGVVATRGLASTHYRYNAFGELISIQKPTGETKTFLYDAGGRKRFESVWDGSAGANTYYDGRGRVRQTVDANGEVTDITYPTPLLKTVTRYPDVEGVPGTATTTFENDVLGRLAKVTDAKGQVTSYTYDPAGRLRFVQQGGQTRTWTYNGLGWLTGLQQPESGATTYSDFTILGKPRTTSYAGRALTTTYDVLGRATDVNAVDGSVRQHFEFDGGAPFNGKLRYSTEPGVRMDYEYQGLNGRLSSLVTTLDPVQGSAVPPFVQSFSYNEYGFRTAATLPSGRNLTFPFDGVRGVATGVQSGGVPMATITEFNAADLPKGLLFTQGLNTVFGYDADQTRLHSMAHRKLDTTLVSPASAWTYTYDGAGGLATDATDAFSYDALGRLTKATVKLPAAWGTNQVLVQDFAYDAFGNQVLSTTVNSPNPVPLGLQKVIGNFQFNTTEQQGSLLARNQLPATAGGIPTGVVYDPQGNLKAVWKRAGASGEAVNLTYDALGRVTEMNDVERGVIEKYAYTPEGLRTRIETYQSNVLQKVQVKVYNDQRQLVSEYEAVAQ